MDLGNNDLRQSNLFTSGSNLLIHKDGRLETSDFISGLQGWQITAENGGKAEFENATIREHYQQQHLKKNLLVRLVVNYM